MNDDHCGISPLSDAYDCWDDWYRTKFLEAQYIPEHLTGDEECSFSGSRLAELHLATFKRILGITDLAVNSNAVDNSGNKPEGSNDGISELPKLEPPTA